MEEQEHSRSEQATSYKLEQARKKGMVARSLEFSTLATMLALAAYLWVFGAGMSDQMQRLAMRALAQAPLLAYGPLELWTWSTTMATHAARIIMPLVLFLVALSMLAILLQIGFVFSVHSLKPDFTRLNPATGFKRIFSIQTLYETGKSVLKLAVYCTLACLVIFAAARYATQSAGEPRAVAALIGDNAVRLVFWLLGAMAVFAAVDLLFVRRQYSKKMMMSRREIREEMRQREGDSRIKQRRRQLAQELLKRARSMRQLRGADVLVTNPTHFAVALRYEPQRMVSPQVVSKGSGEFALRLRRLAFIYGVPTIESRALARSLFFRVALDQPVPEKFFRDTAAVYLRMRTARQARDASSAGGPSMQLV